MNIGQKLVIRVKPNIIDSIENVKSSTMIQNDTKQTYASKNANKTAKRRRPNYPP